MLASGATADLVAVRTLLPSGSNSRAAIADVAEASGGWCAAWHGVDPDGTAAAAAATPLYAISHRSATAEAAALQWRRCSCGTAPRRPPRLLRAVWHASLLRYHHEAWAQSPGLAAAAATAGAATPRALDELHALAHASWPHALEAMRRSGWDVGRVYLDGDGACLEPG